jgi:hypothetical protein
LSRIRPAPFVQETRPRARALRAIMHGSQVAQPLGGSSQVRADHGDRGRGAAGVPLVIGASWGVLGRSAFGRVVGLQPLPPGESPGLHSELPPGSGPCLAPIVGSGHGPRLGDTRK